MGQRVADKVADFGEVDLYSFLRRFHCLAGSALTCLVQQQRVRPLPVYSAEPAALVLAALQAPVIMMSQNRQEEKDRDRAKRRIT